MVAIGGGKFLAERVAPSKLTPAALGTELRQDASLSDHTECAPCGVRPHLPWRPKLHIRRGSARGRPAQRKVELGRHHSDHQAVVAVDTDAAPNDAPIGIESAGPEPVTQDHFIRVARFVLFSKDVTTQHGGNAQCGKKVRRIPADRRALPEEWMRHPQD